MGHERNKGSDTGERKKGLKRARQKIKKRNILRDKGVTKVRNTREVKVR